MGKKKWPTQSQQMAQAANPAHPSVAEMMLEARHFQGPLPPPEQLRAYDSISAGFADRIVKMAEKEQESRHLEKNERLALQRKLLTRGQLFAFILSLVIILAGFGLIIADKPAKGFVSILAGIVTVAAPYLYRISWARRRPSTDRSRDE